MKTLEQLCDKRTDEYGDSYIPTESSLAYIRRKRTQYKRIMQQIRAKRAKIDNKLMRYNNTWSQKRGKSKWEKARLLRASRDHLLDHERKVHMCMSYLGVNFQAEMSQLDKESKNA